MNIETIQVWQSQSSFDHQVNKFCDDHAVINIKSNVFPFKGDIMYTAVITFIPEDARTLKEVNKPTTGRTTPKQAAKFAFEGVKRVTQDVAGDRILVSDKHD